MTGPPSECNRGVHIPLPLVEIDGGQDDTCNSNHYSTCGVIFHWSSSEGVWYGYETHFVMKFILLLQLPCVNCMCFQALCASWQGMSVVFLGCINSIHQFWTVTWWACVLKFPSGGYGILVAFFPAFHGTLSPFSHLYTWTTFLRSFSVISLVCYEHMQPLNFLLPVYSSR